MKKGKDIKYTGFVTEIKQRNVESRYRAARLANRELLLLYLHIGKRISEKIETEKWGTKVLQRMSDDLQSELPGLRGFSYRNLMKMKQFSEEYLSILSFLPLPTAEIGNLKTGNSSKTKNTKLPLPTAEIKKQAIKRTAGKKIIRQSATAQLKKNSKDAAFTEEKTNNFFSVSFTHHVLLLTKCKNKEERFFYMEMAATELWSVSTLEHQITAKLYKHRGVLPNNFKTVLPASMQSTALNTFKDEYLFDFMSLDEDADERMFEEKSVANIRKFILSLGKGFSFIGNQYKIEVSGNEFFIDLLFYNRILQCLVVLELKRGKFKPEYAGKLNFYLNILDDKIKLPHEKPSIGIILCKEKNNTEVEYSFKNIHKAMGVVTYKLSTEVPRELRGILPDAEKLKRLI